MKILNSNNRNFDKALDNLLLQRKRKVQSNSVSVSSIIKDVKKNGDKALLNMKRNLIKIKLLYLPLIKFLNQLSLLIKKLKMQLILHTQEYINFILFKNLRTFHIQIN